MSEEKELREYGRLLKLPQNHIERVVQEEKRKRQNIESCQDALEIASGEKPSKRKPREVLILPDH